MSISAGKGTWQEAPRQATSLRHVLFKQMKKGKLQYSQESISHQKTLQLKGKKRVLSRSACKLLFPWLFFYLLSTAVICHWQLYCGNFLSLWFSCSTFSTVTIRDCMYQSCSFQLKERTSSARSLFVSPVVSLPKI